jgi:hypothetical protein
MDRNAQISVGVPELAVFQISRLSFPTYPQQLPEMIPIRYTALSRDTM